MSEKQDKGTRVEALKYHTFRGKAYQTGDRYAVHGDDQYTTEDVVDSLRGSGLAKPVGEESAKTVEEVQAEESTAVEPLTTENFEKDEPEVKASKDAKDTAKSADSRKPASSGKK